MALEVSFGKIPKENGAKKMSKRASPKKSKTSFAGTKENKTAATRNATDEPAQRYAARTIIKVPSEPIIVNVPILKVPSQKLDVSQFDIKTLTHEELLRNGTNELICFSKRYSRFAIFADVIAEIEKLPAPPAHIRNRRRAKKT